MAPLRRHEIVTGTDMIRKPHFDVEDFLDEKGREWARQIYDEYLALRAGLEKRTDVTVVGRVSVPRLAYQAPGSADLHPMDASLNLPKRG